MKLSNLTIATLAVTALVGGASFAQTDAGASPPPAGPPVTMQPIPNPPETAKPMAMSGKGMHHKWHKKHHMKAKKAAAAADTAATPAPSK